MPSAAPSSSGAGDNLAGSLLARAPKGASIPEVRGPTTSADMLLDGLLSSVSSTALANSSLPNNPILVDAGGGVATSPMGNGNTPSANPQVAAHAAPTGTLSGITALGASAFGTAAPSTGRSRGSQKSLNNPRPTSAPVTHAGRSCASLTTDLMDVQADPGAGKRNAEAPPSPDDDRGRSSQKRRDSTAASSGGAAAPAVLEDTRAAPPDEAAVESRLF